MSIESPATFVGYVHSTEDALIIFQACLQGTLKQTAKRLSPQQRRCIKSGDVFVFEENHSGIKRWTDGKIWSPSRILDDFLVYREVERKEAAPKTLSEYNYPSGAARGALTKDQDDTPQGPLTSQKGTYYFKQGGLIKKTISVIVNGSQHHMVCYYTKEDVAMGLLKRPLEQDFLKGVVVSKELIENQSLRRLQRASFDSGSGGIVAESALSETGLPESDRSANTSIPKINSAASSGYVLTPAGMKIDPYYVAENPRKSSVVVFRNSMSPRRQMRPPYNLSTSHYVVDNNLQSQSNHSSVSAYNRSISYSYPFGSVSPQTIGMEGVQSGMSNHQQGVNSVPRLAPMQVNRLPNLESVNSTPVTSLTNLYGHGSHEQMSSKSATDQNFTPKNEDFTQLRYLAAAIDHAASVSRNSISEQNRLFQLASQTHRQQSVESAIPSLGSYQSSVSSSAAQSLSNSFNWANPVVTGQEIHAAPSTHSVARTNRIADLLDNHDGPF